MKWPTLYVLAPANITQTETLLEWMTAMKIDSKIEFVNPSCSPYALADKQ